MSPLYKKLLAAALIVPFMALLGWLLFLTHQRGAGREVVVAVMGYDPRDLLSGHYIQYQIDWNITDCNQFDDGVCPRDAFCKSRHWGHVCRFYIPEKNAQELDGLFARRNRDGLTFEVVYAYQPGKEPIAKTLLINGMEWQEFIRR